MDDAALVRLFETVGDLPRDVERSAACDRSCYKRRLRVAGLFDGISKGFGVCPDPKIPGHNRDQRRRFAKQLRCCQMHGIERANGFYRKRPADTGEHGLSHGDQI